jgi:hypothetical protein
MTEINRMTSDALLDDVIDEYAAAGPNREELEKWIATYPQFERELTAMTVSWLELKHLRPVPATTDPAEIQTRAESILGHVLHTLQSVSSSASPVGESKEAPEPAAPLLIDSLLEQAQRVGMNVKHVAAATRMSVAMVMSFHRRLVRAASVPREALSALGGALQLSVDALYAYLERPLQVAPQQRFKAKQAPTLQRIDFADLVRRDPDLSERDRDHWLLATSAIDQPDQAK